MKIIEKIIEKVEEFFSTPCDDRIANMDYPDRRECRKICRSGKHSFLITDIQCEDEIWTTTIAPSGYVVSSRTRHRAVQVHECEYCPASEGAEWYKDGPYAEKKITELEARKEIEKMRNRESGVRVPQGPPS